MPPLTVLRFGRSGRTAWNRGSRTRTAATATSSPSSASATTLGGSTRTSARRPRWRPCWTTVRGTMRCFRGGCRGRSGLDRGGEAACSARVLGASGVGAWWRCKELDLAPSLYSFACQAMCVSISVGPSSPAPAQLSHPGSRRFGRPSRASRGTIPRSCAGCERIAKRRATSASVFP